MGTAAAAISKAEAALDQQQAAVSTAEENLRNATIVSPIDGVVLSREGEVGDAVSSILVMGSAATLIMTAGDLNEVYVRGKVDESDVGKVYLGQSARITVESFKDQKFEGRVTKISPMGTEKDNVTTFEVRVSISNEKDILKAQMTANAEIIIEEHKHVLAIPEGAVLYNRDKSTSVQIPDSTNEKGIRRMPDCDRDQQRVEDGSGQGPRRRPASRPSISDELYRGTARTGVRQPAAEPAAKLSHDGRNSLGIAWIVMIAALGESFGPGSAE